MSPSLAGTVVVALLLSALPAAADPAYRYRSPFHPDQCDKAIASATDDLESDPDNRRARLILAEGHLCRGLTGAPAALDTAIDLLQQITSVEPSNFFAQLDLADAIRRRSPFAVAAAPALQRARTLLAFTEVGAARRDLERYIDDNLAAVEHTQAAARAANQSASTQAIKEGRPER